MDRRRLLTALSLASGCFFSSCPYQILVQFEMIELIEGFLLVFPAHVYSSSVRSFQHPIVVTISRSPAGEKGAAFQARKLRRDKAVR